MTKKIICSGDEEILVDNEDYPVLSRHKWHYTANGSKTRWYAVTRLNTDDKSVRTIFMHSMIMGFAFNVDHHDNNTKNNRKKNLRPASWQQNGWNRGKPKSGRHGEPTSQYKGVSYSPLKGKDRWVALIKHVEEGKHKSTGKVIRLGYYDTEHEAALAYDKKVLELRGEWAWTNILKNKNTKVGWTNKSDAEK